MYSKVGLIIIKMKMKINEVLSYEFFLKKGFWELINMNFSNKNNKYGKEIIKKKLLSEFYEFEVNFEIFQNF